MMLLFRWPHNALTFRPLTCSIPIGLFFLILLNCGEAKSEASASLELIANECQKLQKKDEMCTLLVDLHAIGLDVIESIKDRVKLTPEEYTALTIANAFASRRVRIKANLFPSTKINQIIDLRPESVIV